jgi:hypothetical protein
VDRGLFKSSFVFMLGMIFPCLRGPMPSEEMEMGMGMTAELSNNIEQAEEEEDTARDAWEPDTNVLVQRDPNPGN